MNILRKSVLILGFVGMTVLAARSQGNISRQTYIQKYKALVIEHMDLYGIPASVKMAQALLESDDGNSRLAREANNHFGIKCKSTWTGETIAHTDDAKDECFRKYASAEESFRDHSEFLDQSPRYENLFKLDPLDYKAWAYGLQKCGYATNPNYAQQLIQIIDDNQLYLLDEGKDLAMVEKPAASEQVVEVAKPASGADIIDVDNFSVAVQGQNGGHSVYRNNGSLFVVVRPGETLESIAPEFRLSVKKLRKYNDLDRNANVKAGDMVYLKTKDKRSDNGKLIHVAKNGETMHSISQLYGVRLKQLCKINRRTADSPVTEGQQIRLM